MAGKGNLNAVLREASRELKPTDVRARELSCLEILRLYVCNVLCADAADG